MLHWLAGQKATDGAVDPDSAGNIEPPETPAPVFAVRAFKHAIFGTPQTNQAKPRRHSNTEHGRPRNVDSKPARPGLSRPKSSNDAQTLGKRESHTAEEPTASPTKGILLTPGAAAARKKNVTFGEHVLDNEEKRPFKSGLPDDCPGKFPSPWNKGLNEGKKREESPDKARSRSKLTAALEQVRDESRSRKARTEERGKHSDDEDGDLEGEFAEPRSESGKYWKREYDIYRTNTQREVKKLITKQKAAKSFAQMKDNECADLADQLRQEHMKVESLEAKRSELATLVKDLQADLRARQNEDMKHQEEIAMLKRQLGRRDDPNTARHNSLQNGAPKRGELQQRFDHLRTKSEDNAKARTYELQKASIDAEEKQNDPVQRPSDLYNESASPEYPRSSNQGNGGRSRSKPDDVQLKSTDDIWAQLDSSSNPVVAQSANRPAYSTRTGLGVSSGTDATPLQALSINTLSSFPNGRRGSSPRYMGMDCQPVPDLERAESKNSPSGAEQEQGLPGPAPVQPTSPSQPTAAMRTVGDHSSVQRKEAGVRFNGKSNHISESSPFQVDATESLHKTEPCTRLNLETNGIAPSNTKENVSPTLKSPPGQGQLRMKPSVVWSSMNAPTAGKRNASVTGKDGKELSQDRIEAARARIAARGRVTS